MSKSIVHVTERNFETEVLGADGPVLVDYWAPWCGPCRAMEPALEQFAARGDGKVRVAKLDVDQNHEIAARYGIRGVPTMMLFRDGAVVATRVGAMSAAQLSEFVSSHL